MANNNYDIYEVDCFSVGNSGKCGFDCPIFIGGDCEHQDEGIDNIIDSHGTDIKSVIGTGLYEEEVDDMIMYRLVEFEEVKQKDSSDDFDRSMDIFK